MIVPVRAESYSFLWSRTVIRRIDDEGDGALSADPALSDASSSDGRKGAEAVVSAARRVLEIVPRERRLLPEFGCRIHSLGSLRTTRDRDLAAGLVEEALERWVPDLGIDRVEVRPSRDGWIRVAIHVVDRWSEFEIKHRRERAEAPVSPPSVKRSHEAREEPAA